MNSTSWWKEEEPIDQGRNINNWLPQIIDPSVSHLCDPRFWEFYSLEEEK